MDDLKAASQRKISFWQTMRAVAWSFFGVRHSQDQEKDVAQLNPIHVVIAGVLAAVVLVVALVVLVQWVLVSGVATYTPRN
jgi:preprotein translocase subunit Sec61beta